MSDDDLANGQEFLLGGWALVAAALGDHGFDVECAACGQDALDRAVVDRYAAIVLDRMLPGGVDGLTVLSSLRGLGVDAPVLILSALSAVDERVRGLRAGGDDYLTKPFESLELTARIEVLLRRRTVPDRERMTSDSVTAPPAPR